MKAIIKKSSACGRITVPPSKSAAHRLIIAAALANGVSEIKNVDLSEDIKATLRAAEAFGINYSYKNGDLKIVSEGLSVKKTTIDCNESGSTLRFMIPIALTFDSKITFKGARSLMERPLRIYEEICEKNGLLFERNNDEITVKGPLTSGNYEINGNISSQFITGLLFVLPLLNGNSAIKIIPPFESKPYVEMTFDTLTKSGIKFDYKDNEIFIPGNQRYKTLNETVEGDWSNAAFPEAFNLIGGNVEVTGLDENSRQGDKIYRKYFKILNEDVPSSAIDITDCPDLAPVLTAIAAVKNGAVFTGTKRLKFKECNRGEAMRTELAKFGVKTVIEEDRIIVYKSNISAPTEILNSHNDHRIAMALSIPSSITGGIIENCSAVRKSYPNYWEDIKKLGIEVYYD